MEWADWQEGDGLHESEDEEEEEMLVEHVSGLFHFFLLSSVVIADVR